MVRSQEANEIATLAQQLVNQVVNAAKQKVDCLKKIPRTDHQQLIEKATIDVVNSVIEDASKQDLDFIKKSAILLVNQVIEKVCSIETEEEIFV